MIYVLVKLEDGSTVVAPYQRLRGIGRYSAQVMSGAKPLNLWTVRGEAHPVTGERILMRSRRTVSGKTVREMQVVTPKADADAAQIDALAPDAFEPAVEPQSIGFGLYTVDRTKTLEDGIVLPAGTVLPIHRDTGLGERYVVACAGTGEANEGEVRWYYERRTEDVRPGDGDDVGGEGYDDFSDDDDDE
jgi:hypothetical protein